MLFVRYTSPNWRAGHATAYDRNTSLSPQFQMTTPSGV